MVIAFESLEQLYNICGEHDKNIAYLEELMHIKIFLHGNTIVVEEDVADNILEVFEKIIQDLKELSMQGRFIDIPLIFMTWQEHVESVQNNSKPDQDYLGNSENSLKKKKLLIKVGGKEIHPKSNNQKKYISSLESTQIVFGIGPAGTGKTFLAIAKALELVLSGKCQKIIMTRPVVEAGENLGFLPGDLTQKISPYLRPLYDAMEMLIPLHIIKKMEENGAIEIAPLAYMRGRSLQNACILLDEAQNTTKEQMMMFLTRMGENSRVIITGDITQIDLPKKQFSGLVHAMRILENIEEIDFIQFTSADVIRSKLVRMIIEAYEKEHTNIHS